MTTATQLRALIADLESAPEGSPELDQRIALQVCGPNQIKRYKHRNCWPWFSRSLDAALPGEEITQTVSYGGHWRAWAKDRHWHRHAKAATEPLARRAAALRAMLHEMENKDAL